MDKDQQKKNEGEKEFTVQPIKETSDPKFAPFNANPGPAQTQNLPAQEGTKEDRQARKEALNK
ncbi:centromere protein Cenp-O [Purpureocillium lavendulum]|uniref:Centromere protein Cenp-O n=1 Tax=Purpureocillium lavendulum TaxID=1247861 RepID=A0AB34FYE6_9HYPO|nr:centromere protein Cenp-O [Purpureocillium lavendulum]